MPLHVTSSLLLLLFLSLHLLLFSSSSSSLLLSPLRPSPLCLPLSLSFSPLHPSLFLKHALSLYVVHWLCLCPMQTRITRSNPQNPKPGRYYHYSQVVGLIFNTRNLWGGYKNAQYPVWFDSCPPLICSL